MKRSLVCATSALIVGVALIVVASRADETDVVAKMTSDAPVWARNTEGFFSEALADGAVRIRHAASTDWAARIPGRIKTRAGELFRLKWRIKNEGSSPCAPGVVLYDATGEALDWNYGGAEVFHGEDWQVGQSRFAVPRGVEEIEARVIGHGETDVSIGSFEIYREGGIALAEEGAPIVAENAALRLELNPGDASFSVEDKRTGRVWRQDAKASCQFVVKVEAVDGGARFALVDGRNLLVYRATVALVADAPEVAVELGARDDAEQTQPITYPLPFTSRTTDRVVLPVNEGISFPTTEPTPGLGTIHTFGGHGLCMAFWGVVADEIDASKCDGMMGIIETPDDSDVELRARASSDEPQTLATSLAPRWHGSKGKFGYAKRLRYVFFESGGHVALCKRYRAYAREIGLLVPFEEKIKRNPKLKEGLRKLQGAANIWAWDGDRMETIRMLNELGIDRILWSGGGTSDDLDAMNDLPNVLTSRYDIYQDVMNPERFSELNGVHGDWVTDAWPRDLAWDSPDGHWTRGWEVDAKDPTQPRIPCGVLCDAKAIPYAKARIGIELQTKHYRARFLDTTTASPWRECWNPHHPMTRSDCKRARMELLDLIHSFGLVCGSETGIDAAVPYCDFFEGMESLGPYRCKDSGRYLTRIWDEVPEVVEKYQLGETYRLPLFELVYRDCLVAYWYWGDHNNKFPSVWKKRDLFNALYGTPPMYCFTRKFLDANRERFKESWKIASSTAKEAPFAEMTDHVFLTEDRKFQKTVFSNGLRAYVNFADEEREADGVAVPAGSVVVKTD